MTLSSYFPKAVQEVDAARRRPECCQKLLALARCPIPLNQAVVEVIGVE
jgi:hypothetical protein